MTDATKALLEKVQAAISDMEVPLGRVQELLAELAATGDDQAIATASMSMEWRNPDHESGAPQTTGDPDDDFSDLGTYDEMFAMLDNLRKNPDKYPDADEAPAQP
jgi:hypothetical protein